MSAEPKPIASLLAEVSTKVGAVRKDSINQHQHFNFRGIDAVVNSVAGPLHAAGIVGPFPEVLDDSRTIGQTRSGGSITSVTVKVRYTLHGPRGDSLSGVVIAEAFDSGDKATAKAMSVAMRTFLLQALCLPTDDPDPDSYTYDHPVEAAKPALDWSPIRAALNAGATNEQILQAASSVLGKQVTTLSTLTNQDLINQTARIVEENHE